MLIPQAGQPTQTPSAAVQERDVTPDRRPPAGGQEGPTTPPQRRERRPMRRPPPAASVEPSPGPGPDTPVPWRTRPLAGGVMAACAHHLGHHLGRPGQPLHTCLSDLYGDAQMASNEVQRSLAVLRDLCRHDPFRPERRGRVAILLPTQQPLYALVSQVLLAATLSEQVRATTSFGRLQQVTIKMFDWLAESMGVAVRRAVDGSTQQGQAEGLGSMMLVHPTTADSSVRLSLALPAYPDAILWSGSVPGAQQASRQVGGRPVFMPLVAATCTVVAEQSAAELSAAAASLANGMTHHAHRAVGTPAAILVHAEVLTPFLAQLLRRLRAAGGGPPTGQRSACFLVDHLRLVLTLRSLTAADRAPGLGPPSQHSAGFQRRELTMLSYRRDEELSGYFSDLGSSHIQVSLFGPSPAVVVAVPRDRLRLGHTAIQAEDQLADRGGGGSSICRVQGSAVSFHAASLQRQLGHALGLRVLPPTYARAALPDVDP